MAESPKENLSFAETIKSKWGVIFILGSFVIGIIVGNLTAAASAVGV